MLLAAGDPGHRFGPLAFVLTLFAPGLGHLYLGYRGAAVLMLVGLGIGQLLLATALVALRVPALTTVAVMLLVGGGVVLALAVDAWVRARRGGRAAATHWAAYFGFLVLAIVVSLSGTALRKGYVIDTLRNPSGSMEPTIREGDHFVVTKWHERGQMPARGDLVVFHYPLDPGELFLKRVVAVGGDTVEDTPERLVVNDAAWPRRPCEEGSSAPPRCVLERAPDGREFTIREEVPAVNSRRVRATVPAGQIWVRGDNRGNSHDSASFGPVPVEAVVGHARAIFLPLDRLGPVE